MKNFFVVTVCSLLSASIALAETPMQITTQDGNKLSAIMTSPEGPSKGALLIIQGSGNVGTDGDVSGPFLGQGFGGAKANLSDQLAHRITDAGYSTLRFAKAALIIPKNYLTKPSPTSFKTPRMHLKL